MQAKLNRAGLAFLATALVAFAVPLAAQNTTPTLRTGPAPGGAPAAGAPVIGGAAGAAPAAPAPAQEFTQSHINAALDFIGATQVGKDLDQILPLSAQQTQAQLIQLRPDLFKQIGEVVQAAALKATARRNDLGVAVARVYAANFTEDELKAIGAFFKSPAGQKFATKTVELQNQIPQVVQSWRGRLIGELMQSARDEMQKRGIDF